MEDIKLAIVGSRKFNDYTKFISIINSFKDDYDLNFTQIISGGAAGADTFAERYAEINKIPKRIFRAEWEKFGRKAGPIRNVDIIKACDVCVAFWDGQSRGTAHDIKLCKEYDKELWIYNYITDSFYQEN